MDGIPALRYGPPDNFLDNAQDNPNNTCFSTPSYSGLPSGVLLNGPCFMGACIGPTLRFDRSEGMRGSGLRVDVDDV